MATFETGERWQGNRRGRPTGSKDRVPRNFRALVNEILEKHPGEIKTALLKGLRGRSAHRVLAIFAGLERRQVELGGRVEAMLKITHELPE